MADEAKARLGKAAKLLELQLELIAKLHDVTTELHAITSGGVTVGDQLKAFRESFDRIWGARYNGGVAGGYIWQFTKDVPQQKRLLKMLPLEELERRATNYLRNPDPFYVKNRHSFGLFVSSINSHADEPTEREEMEHAAPADCKHVPPCKSDAQHTKKRGEDMRQPF